MNTIKMKTLAAAVGLCTASQAFAGYEFNLENGDQITFGGYIKADARYVDGDVKYQDYWRGNNPGFEDTSKFGMTVSETRFNTKYVHGDVTAFIEMDFYGGDGNEVATNSTNPRLRHAFVKYKGWMAGQYWSTFTPMAAWMDALDFGGPIVGEVFVRQPQIRYTVGGFKFAIENPETWGNDYLDAGGNGGGNNPATVDSDAKYPDLVAAYAFKGDWGEVQFSALYRTLEGDANEAGRRAIDESALAGNIGGKINIGRDDIRFQVNFGESGRYVGAGMVRDIVLDSNGQYEVEETTAFTVAYRHLWSDNWRSTAYYGYAETDTTDFERAHWGVNLIRQLTPALSVGVELGNFDISDGGDAENGDSNYFQLSAKFGI